MSLLQSYDELLDHPDFKRSVEEFKQCNPDGITDYRIAVEALIFTKDGKLLLEKRGPQALDANGLLEGVGGAYRIEHHGLLERLHEEIKTEVGHDIVVEIERLLEIKGVCFEQKDAPNKTRWSNWIVVSYLCRHVSGKFVNGEPEKIDDLVYLTLDELQAWPEHELSPSTIQARKTYKEKYGSKIYFDVQE